MTVATASCPSLTTGRCSPAPTLMMQPCGSLMIEVNCLMPNMPRLDTEKVPPWNSSGFSLRSRARLARSLDSVAICARPLVSAFLMIGVIRPPSIATAMETSALWCMAMPSGV
ncbi:hypothetical protein D3C72_1807940 [compost metagenome]